MATVELSTSSIATIFFCPGTANRRRTRPFSGATIRVRSWASVAFASFARAAAFLAFIDVISKASRLRSCSISLMRACPASTAAWRREFSKRAVIRSVSGTDPPTIRSYRPSRSAASAASASLLCKSARSASNLNRFVSIPVVKAARSASNISTSAAAASLASRESISINVAITSPSLTAAPSSTLTWSMKPSVSAVTLIGWGSGSTQPEAWNNSRPATGVTGAGDAAFSTVAGLLSMATAGETTTPRAGINRSRNNNRKTKAKPSNTPTGNSQVARRLVVCGAAG